MDGGLAGHDGLGAGPAALAWARPAFFVGATHGPGVRAAGGPGVGAADLHDLSVDGASRD